MSTGVRNRAFQAFWVMHVEAMNWSGMGVRVAALEGSDPNAVCAQAENGRASP